ncbi:MAG: hypothetical protein FWD06_03740 [Oscillospiraceae bacterium]|nr:hypothetical protein [Oscillospiraceae bacterium]
MKKIFSILMVVALIAGFGIVATQASTSITETQLVGRWRVTSSQNQVFRPNDVIVFNAGGSGQIIRANGATSGMTHQFIQSGGSRFLRMTSAALPSPGTMSFSQVNRVGNNLTIGTTQLTLVQQTPTPPTPPTTPPSGGGSTIPGTNRPATTWNWFLFVFVFGWIWM